MWANSLAYSISIQAEREKVKRILVKRVSRGVPIQFFNNFSYFRLGQHAILTSLVLGRHQLLVALWRVLANSDVGDTAALHAPERFRRRRELIRLSKDRLGRGQLAVHDGYKSLANVVGQGLSPVDDSLSHKRAQKSREKLSRDCQRMTGRSRAGDAAKRVEGLFRALLGAVKPSSAPIGWMDR